MKKRIFFIILGALLVLALIIVLWFLFFGRDRSDALPNTGSFGTGGNVTGGTGGNNGGGNNQAPIGSNTGSGGTGTGGTGAGGSGGSVVITGPGTYTIGTSSLYVPTPGITWLDGSGGSVNNRFIPTPINQLNSINVSGIGNINAGTEGSGGLGFGEALLGAAAAGAVACTPGLLSSLGITGAVTAAVAAPGGLPVKSYTSDTISGIGVGLQASEHVENFMDCMARAIARVALQQITISIVEWIDSGFNGQPSFVQDYEQFFTDVADKAAGEFIQGSGLSFLCSPFQLQIKIAIAQSYANRKSSGAGNSCTLTNVVGNVERFLEGNFSEGGWPGFLSLTTEPQNNPYGAYTKGIIDLETSIQNAQVNAKLTISPEGFLSTTEEYDCETRRGAGGEVFKVNCKTRIVTPGSNIAASMQKVLDLPIDQNLLADSFDEIINALMNQLITKTLYGGLANLNKGGSGSAQVGIDAAQTLLTNLQGAAQLAQQYGSAQQGSINDIQVAQGQLNTLYNCWATAALQPGLSSSQVAQAESNASVASTTIRSLETRVAFYNNNITRANTAVSTIQQLQTSALLATSLKEVQAVQAQFTTAQNSGSLITQANVTSAQQDRQTLQSEMNGINQNTSSQLTQCYAFGN